MDLPQAMTVPEISEALGLTRLSKDRKWFVQASSAPLGNGLYEGMSREIFLLKVKWSSSCQKTTNVT